MTATEPVDLSTIKFHKLTELYANSAVSLSSLSLVRIERAIIQDAKTFAQIVRHSSRLEWIELQSVTVSMLAELDHVVKEIDRPGDFGLVIQLKDDKQPICLKQVSKLFPRVKHVRFFETSALPCSCFGEVDAQYICPGMQECPLTETRVDQFDFTATTIDGFYDDAYEGLLMSHRSRQRDLFFDMGELLSYDDLSAYNIE